MKPHSLIARWIGPMALLLMSTTVAADVCPSYDTITENLQNRYGEQRLFTGFGSAERTVGANEIYEFWGNPQSGGWSLVVHKLVVFANGTQTTTGDCAFLVAGGKRHQRLNAALISTAAANEPTQVASGPNCLAHAHHRQILGEKYREVPLFRALGKDQTLVEIFAGESSWTITRSQVRELTHPVNGAALRDKSTGQEVMGLCSRAMFSGAQWGEFAPELQGAI